MTTLARAAALAVRAERARSELTQQQLADQLGWHQSTVADIESGERSIKLEELVPLCRALNVRLIQLIDRADPDDLRALGLG